MSAPRTALPMPLLIVAVLMGVRGAVLFASGLVLLIEGTPVGVVPIAVAILSSIVVIGLWRGSRVAYGLAAVLAGLDIVGLAPSIMIAGGHPMLTVHGILGYGIALLVLLTVPPSVRSHFRRTPAAPEPAATREYATAPR